MKKIKSLENELEKLKNIPRLSEKEQRIIDALAKAMAERAFADLNQEKRHKPVKHKK